MKLKIKILYKLEYLCIDLSGFFDQLSRKIKGKRWKIEEGGNKQEGK